MFLTPFSFLILYIKECPGSESVLLQKYHVNLNTNSTFSLKLNKYYVKNGIFSSKQFGNLFLHCFKMLSIDKDHWFCYLV
jgi:hypothetical protein